MSLFFRVLLGHIVGDFVLQTIDLVRYKSGSWKGQILHAGIVLVSVALFLWDDLFSWWPWLLVLFVLHLLSDWAKVLLTRRVAGWGLALFLGDQAVHLGTIVLLVYLSEGAGAFASLAVLLGGTGETNRQLLFLLVLLISLFVVPLLEAQTVAGVMRRPTEGGNGSNCVPATLADRLLGGGERVLVLAFWYFGGGLVWLTPLAFLPRALLYWREGGQNCRFRSGRIRVAVSIVCLLFIGLFLWWACPRL